MAIVTLTRRVLVVDDDPDTVTTAAMLLELEGLEVYTALNGVDALECGEEVHPDVVFLDITMPQIDGFAVANAMRATDWGRVANIVAVTANGSPATRSRCLNGAFDHYALKPVDYRELARTIYGHNPARRKHDGHHAPGQ